MKSDVMLSYMPTFLRDAKEIKAVINAQGYEFDLLETSADDVLKQFYVETATWGLALWENELGIKIDNIKPYDQRRSVIISKLRGVGTVTLTMLKSVAESFTNGSVDVRYGPSCYSFDTYREMPATNPDYTIIIKFIGTRGIPPNLNDLKAAIEEIKPAHLAVEYQFRYLTWDELDTKNLTWDQLDALNLTWDKFETGAW